MPDYQPEAEYLPADASNMNALLAGYQPQQQPQNALQRPNLFDPFGGYEAGRAAFLRG